MATVGSTLGVAVLAAAVAYAYYRHNRGSFFRRRRQSQLLGQPSVKASSRARHSSVPDGLCLTAPPPAHATSEECAGPLSQQPIAQGELIKLAASLNISHDTFAKAYQQLVAQIEAQADIDGHISRFATDTHELQFGRMADAALGMAAYLCVSEETLYTGLACGVEGQQGTAGLPALRAEFEAFGTETDKLCMRYVLDGEAGSCDIVFPNGNMKLDCDATGAVHFERTKGGGVGASSGAIGWRLSDFAAHPKAQLAGLSMAETAALRLYTTAAFQSINNPLRDRDRRARNIPHRLPITVELIRKGVSKLRAVGAEGPDSNQTIHLYRGMRNRELPSSFLEKGGTELAPMSTTCDLGIALSYSASSHGVIFRLRTHSSMERGADLTFLSCFPGEREYLFPPLTYLQPARPVKTHTVQLAGTTFTFVDVEPKM